MYNRYVSNILKRFWQKNQNFLFSLMKYISPSILHLPRLLKHVYFKWWLRQTKRKHGGAFWLFCLSYFLADPSSYPQERTQEMKGRKKEVKDGSSEKYTYSTRLEAWHFRHGALCNMGHSGMGPCLSFPRVGLGPDETMSEAWSGQGWQSTIQICLCCWRERYSSSSETVACIWRIDHFGVSI